MKKSYPLVSVVIPTYNQAQFLGQAINSVLSQTYDHYEIIVVDDGSSDDTSTVINQFAGKIRYIHQDNQGLAGARNTAIRAANGEFIGLLDSDDVWMPIFLEHLVNLVNMNPEAVACYCNAECIDVEGNILPQIVGGGSNQPSDLYYDLIRANYLIPSTIILRRSVLIENSLFDQSLRSCEDWDLWLRILKDHVFCRTPEVLVRYRIHSSSLSTKADGMIEAAQAVIYKHFGPDDGDYQKWSNEKKRAYGGLYQYFLMVTIQRKHDWKSGMQYLSKAFQSDPSLFMNLNLFYDLALGSQPIGYRGTSYHLNLQENEEHILEMLSGVFKIIPDSGLKPIHNQTLGTAYYALGLVAYNTKQLSLCRRYLYLALRFRPDLWKNTKVLGNLTKSCFGNEILDHLRNLRAFILKKLPIRKSFNKRNASTNIFR